MIESLENLDTSLFQFLNSLHSPFMDFVMQQFSEKYFWIPLYIILLYPLWKRYGKKIYLPLLAIGILITLSDQLSVNLFKDVFERYRPCHNEILKSTVHLVDGHCGGKFGFISSHASNTFALAVFLALQLYYPMNKYAYLLLIWATGVAYSRIYLGVHYPGDVVGGALFGTLLALVINFMLNQVIRRFNISIS